MAALGRLDYVKLSEKRIGYKDTVPFLVNTALPTGVIAGILASLYKNRPTAVLEADDEDSPNSLSVYRKQSGVLSPLLGMLGDAGGAALEGLSNAASEVVKAPYATSKWHLPLFAPAAAATAVGSAAGAHYLTNKLFEKLRADKRKAEIEEAQREYEQALSSYKNSEDSKEAEERCELAKDMDRIVNCFEKLSRAQPSTYNPTGPRVSASGSKPHMNILSTVLGAYLTYALAAGAYGARQGFKAERKDSPSKAVDRAVLEKRLDKQDELNPTYADVV